MYTADSKECAVPPAELAVDRSQPLPKLLRRTAQHHAWLLFLCLAYVAAVAAVLKAAGLSHPLVTWSYLLGAAAPPLAAVLFITAGHAAYHLLHVRPFAWRGLAAAIREDPRLTRDRAVFALIPVLLVPCFAGSFTAFKNAIPHILPFAFDLPLMQADRFLHFGQDPWILLQPLLGQPLVTSLISYLYNLWLPLMYLVFYWQVFSQGDLRLRMQYLLSFVVTWALCGSLLALLLSSAGPWLFQELTGLAEPYGPLMDYLYLADQSFKNWSLEAQAYLWASYHTQEVATGGGISAMPSLHVAIAVLQALLGWRVNRRLGLLFTLYAAVILIGSVHLAWHYALDGYLSILLALVIWKLVGWALSHHPGFAKSARRAAPESAAGGPAGR